MGGTLGTAARAAIEGAFPHTGETFPWATFFVNVTGALLLGLLIEAVALHRGRPATARKLRLALGTGLLGGYTTYSTFILESLLLGSGQRLVTALTYDSATLVAGFLAAFLTMSLYRRYRLAQDGTSGGGQDA
ncbi:MAG: CrcB family protein [Intrasporangiaceae bacterium]|nr:CrcB family protein [Intrasporangiaceae bacterium]